MTFSGQSQQICSIFGLFAAKPVLLRYTRSPALGTSGWVVPFTRIFPHLAPNAELIVPFTHVFPRLVPVVELYLSRAFSRDWHQFPSFTIYARFPVLGTSCFPALGTRRSISVRILIGLSSYMRLPWLDRFDNLRLVFPIIIGNNSKHSTLV